MEEVVRKVEEVLNTLECGLEFVKEPLPGEGASFTCYGSQKLRIYGVEMEAGIVYFVERNGLGEICVDKWFTTRTDGKELGRVEEIQLLKEKSGQSDEYVDGLYDCICELMGMEEERLFELVTEEFETRLPDIEIVDRSYGFRISA